MNLFELFVKIGVDDKASKEISNISAKLGTGLKSAAKIGAAAVATTAAGIATLAAGAVKNFAEYEQLIGGVETLFGESANKIKKYAEGAYKSAGMSANDYMSTVTSFSASLLQSLSQNTEKAAEFADMAITDMSDNVNKLGTDMSMIQNAYQGFAKQNYTMLDNLKLGYGGTKNEMERLIKDANRVKEANGEMADLSIESFADIIEAIHIVQSEMGITGTTAEEAATTIRGSFNTVKAAWDNLLTGLADDTVDFDKLMNNFVESIDTLADNLGPRVQVAVGGAVKLIKALLPGVVEALPGIIEENAPLVGDAVSEIIGAVLDTLSEHGDELIDAGFTLSDTLIEMLSENDEKIAQTAVDLINAFGTSLGENAEIVTPAVANIILTVVNKLTEPENVSKMDDAAIALVMGLVRGIIAAIPEITEQAPEIVANLVEAIISEAPKLSMAGYQLIWELITGLTSEENKYNLQEGAGDIIIAFIQGFVNWFAQVKDIGSTVFEEFKKGLFEYKEDPEQWGKDLIDNFINGIKERFKKLTETMTHVAQSIRDIIGFSEPKTGPLSNFHTYAPDMMELFAQGVRENEKTVTDQIERSFDFGRRTINADFAVKTLSSAGEAPASAARQASGVTVNITVNGAEYGDGESMAEAIVERLQRLFESRGMIYA